MFWHERLTTPLRKNKAIEKHRAHLIVPLTRRTPPHFVALKCDDDSGLIWFSASSFHFYSLLIGLLRYTANGLHFQEMFQKKLRRACVAAFAQDSCCCCCFVWKASTAFISLFLLFCFLSKRKVVLAEHNKKSGEQPARLSNATHSQTL